jgi:basic membrane protein A
MRQSQTLRRLLVALPLAALVLTGCGGDDTDDTATDGTDAASEAATDAASDGASPAATGGGDATAAGGDQTFAIILPGPIQDADYNAIAYEGLDDLAADFGITTEYSEQVAVADAERVAREYIDSGADMVAFHGGQFLTIATDLAAEFPDTVFIAESSGEMADQPDNVWNIAREFAPGFYVQGAHAALMTESNTIAFLGGIDIPDYKAGANAMFAGARAVNPDVELLYNFTGDQNDAVTGRQSADALIGQGADVLVLGLNNAIYGVAEASAAADSPVYMTSSFTDKVSIAPDTFLMSTIWDFTGAFAQAIEGIQAGETSGVIPMSPASGLITLGELHNTPDDVAAQVTDLWDQVVAGEVEVPVMTDEVVVP